jgi:flavorubredoxin
MSANAIPTFTPGVLSFPPISPTITVPPTKVAPDTWVIHQVQTALGEPLEVFINSMVILGSEPVIVDTGTPGNRAQWLEDVFTLVEPEDVKWIYLSHDDVDHSGNLDEVMTACPNAKLVCNWAMVERHSNCFHFPLDRLQWVMHEESFDVGDRTLHAIRPPVYDSPTTRGLYDPKSKVYWAVDSFATPLPDSKLAISDLDDEFWTFGMTLFAYGAVSPWLAMTDPAKFNQHVDLSQNLDINTIASCHSPILEGDYIAKAFEKVRQLPTVDPPPMPDQSVLDQIIAATSQPPA